MLSIFIMYSTDRVKPLEYTISCLKDMPYYDDCQKILIVDGRTNIAPKNFDIIQVPRINDEFCWANMWDAGVCASRFEKILYLDSDRLLPQCFLKEIIDKTKDNCFVFTSRHFLVTEDMDLDVCKNFLQKDINEEIFVDPEYIGKLKFDARFKDPVHGPGKNVMSGSVSFTKKTYEKLGGVDPWYRGHGAFADTDFHLQASQSGCRFVDLEIPELHYHHDKLGDKIPMDEMTLKRMGLDNFIYYCKKWGLPAVLAEGLAVNCGVLRPVDYVEAKWNEGR